jgi:streptogramin lyase
VSFVQIPNAGYAQNSIALGSDGNLWSDAQVSGYSAAVEFTTSGPTSHALALTTVGQGEACLGSDGNVWFTSNGSTYVSTGVYKVTTSGAYTYYAGAVPSYDGPTAYGMFSGPDGRIWQCFSDSGLLEGLSAYTTSGVRTDYDFHPAGPRNGVSDGTDMWVVDAVGPVRQIDTSGTILNTYTGSWAAWPQDICYDGTNFWIADPGGQIVRMTPGGSFSYYACGTEPWGICTNGTDLWITDTGASAVIHAPISNPNTQTTYALGSSVPLYVCFDGLGNVWVTDQSVGGGVWTNAVIAGGNILMLL